MNGTPIPSPHELAGESGRTPAVTTRRIDVLTQRVTKLESQMKEAIAMIAHLGETRSDLQDTLLAHEMQIEALERRVTELEQRPAGPVVKHFKDELFEAIKDFMLGHPGIKMNQAMVAANVGAGPDRNHLVHSRLQRLVKEQLLETDKIVGRERTYWAPLPKK